MTDLEIIVFISGKMAFAILCGAFVGVERNLNDSSAGFKTQILVCVGAMLFTIVPRIATPSMPAETARVIAQIISGVGFLGAGAIIRNPGSHGNHVTGLTTAAWIWFTAAIGVMIGLEHGLAACFTTISLVVVISLTRKLERTVFNRRTRSTDRPSADWPRRRKTDEPESGEATKTEKVA